VDSRGAGRSGGYFEPFYWPRETRDLYLCIEWAGTQPWSNGKVGLCGISYPASNQWRVAALQPPHLAAITPWEGAADAYRDATYHGGILCTFRSKVVKALVNTVQHGLGERSFRSPVTGEPVAGPETLSEQELAANRADVESMILAHPLDDELYRERSAQWEKVSVPLLSAANWGGQGLHPRGNFEGFVRAASKEKWLEVHGREHWTEFYTPYGVALQKRFFEYYLKGIDNGWKERPRVQLQIRTVNGFVERAENEWPLARTKWTKLYLDPAGRALEPKQVEERGSIEYEAMGDGVTFLSAPLPEETEITGPVAAKLFISSSTIDADLFLVLRAFAPDGREVVFQGSHDPHTPIGLGWLRASHRKLDPELSTEYRPYHTHDVIEPLTPGRVYELDVEIWPTCIVVPAGYRIALSVRGKDYEYAGEASVGLATVFNQMKGCGPFLHDDPRNRPPEIFGGRITVHAGGQWASRLLLPVVPEKSPGG
jgi:uncharacterized protein